MDRCALKPAGRRKRGLDDPRQQRDLSRHQRSFDSDTPSLAERITWPNRQMTPSNLDLQYSLECFEVTSVRHARRSDAEDVHGDGDSKGGDHDCQDMVHNVEGGEP